MNTYFHSSPAKLSVMSWVRCVERFIATVKFRQMMTVSQGRRGDGYSRGEGEVNRDFSFSLPDAGASRAAVKAAKAASSS